MSQHENQKKKGERKKGGGQKETHRRHSRRVRGGTRQRHMLGQELRLYSLGKYEGWGGVKKQGQGKKKQKGPLRTVPGPRAAIAAPIPAASRAAITVTPPPISGRRRRAICCVGREKKRW